jgi:hypothetical protein
MLNVGLVVKAKCNRHPKFNPAKASEGMVKGGCATCFKLLEQWETLRTHYAALKAAGVPVESRGLFQ